jgi:hypothetical protein
MSAPVRDIRLGLSGRPPGSVHARAMLLATISDAVAFAIVDLTNAGWPPGAAAGSVTDWWEDNVERAFIVGVRRGYEFLGRADLVEEYDQLEDLGESTWCSTCIARRVGALAA